MIATLLVIDDDDSGRRLIKAIFTPQGFKVADAPDGLSGVQLASAESPDVVLLDLHLPDLDGFQVLEELKKRAPALPVVMLTGSLEIKDAVRAMQLGAFDYLTKPIDKDEVIVVVGRALEAGALRSEVEDLRRRVQRDAAHSLTAQMGPSPQVQQVVDQVGTVAASTFTVVILGETGTGKELVAQALHQQSDRRRKPFVALDCGAIPEQLLESELFGHERGAFTGADRRKEGRLRLAEGGTCFLDEVGNLPTNLQVKLLRVLESRQMQAVGAERPVPLDVRFIAATNEDLQVRVAEGRFRPDLYFRLAQYTISLPPLRERPEDIAYLTKRFVEEASIELRRPIQAIAPDALDLLRRHPWPGNVRQLRNVVRQAVLETSDLMIRAALLQAILGDAKGAVRPPPPPIDRSLREIADQAARTAERHAICEALRESGGNKSQSARMLKTDYKTLHLKIRQLGIDARQFHEKRNVDSAPASAATGVKGDNVKS